MLTARSSLRPFLPVFRPLVVGLVGLLWTSGGATAQAPLSPDQWRADLDELVGHLLENHRNPFHTIDEGAFRAAASELRGRIDSLSGNEVALGFAQLLASVGDGHTRLTIPANPENLGYAQAHTPDPAPAPGAPRFSTLPVRFMEFQEGIHVVAVTRGYEGLLGHRVLSIGRATPDSALAALKPFVAHDTPAGLRFNSIKLLAVPELLAEAGVVDDARVIDVETRPPGPDVDGASTFTALLPVAYDSEPEWMRTGHGILPAPADSTPYLALEEGPDGVVVVRLNQINDSPTESIGAFSNRLSRMIEDLEPDRVILDLRYCHGGDQSLSRALVLPLVRWPPAQRPGHLYALVGPETFSAAVNLASRLEEWTQITFVGEPLGSGPSHYSSSDREVLEHSGLVVRVSTGYFVGWTGSEWRESVEIGVPVRARIEAFLNGRDVVLDAAIGHEAGAEPAEQIRRAFDTGGINAALIVWSRFRTDPATAPLAGPELGNGFAQYLFDRGESRFAAGIFLFNREFHPSSIEAYLGEAEARIVLGEKAQARAVLEEASQRAPGDPRVAALMSRLDEGRDT
ncbi:MAG: tetratricopeptide repeat protein [Gemmatimonadota bacterium]|nr:tetratricopeptide repeat protein [Gemmatimonadota bacterium]